jgi:hypothetical protein
VDGWGEAELVTPNFAALLGSHVDPGTTVVVHSPEGLTAIHWDQSPVPSAVLFRPVLPEASAADRTAVRDELLRAAGGSRKVIELAAPPTEDTSPRAGTDFHFRAGDHASRLSTAQAAALDVRDKAELAVLRQSRARDIMLWRIFLGCVAAMLFVAVGWAAIYAAGFWQRTRERKMAAQQPVVEQVMTAQSLSTRINELSSKRLLPLEMISLVSGIKPASIQFLRASTDGLYSLRVDAQTTSPGEVSTFRTALSNLSSVEKVEVRDQRTRDNLMSFTLIITFKPDALKPATPS